MKSFNNNEESHRAQDEAILLGIGDGLVATDKDGFIISINKSAKKLLHVRKDVIGKKFINLILMEDENGNIIKGSQRPLNQVLATGKIISSDDSYLYVRMDKTKFPITITVAPVILRSNLIGAVEVFKDVSEEKKRIYLLEQQTQELTKFQMAVEDASDQIVISDTEGIVIYANKAIEKITGYSVKEIIGTKAGSLWGGHMEKSFYQTLWRTIKIDKKPFISQINNKRKSGQGYTAEIRISPVLDRLNNPIYFVSIERDITHEKQIDQAKTEFVSIASHQLRTPLGIARWYLEAISQDKYFKELPRIEKRYLNEVYKSNERVLSLVRNLLSVSRIDQEKVKDSPRPVNIIVQMKEEIERMQILAHKRQVALHLTIKDHNIPTLNIDLLRFNEVIENLVANAIRYTKASGRIDVILKKVRQDLLVIIKDTGIGIAIEDQKRLFTKFFRSEKAVRFNPEGSGLGLYVVKSYVDGWGGKISIESEEGKGSTFTVSLPIKQSINKTNRIRKKQKGGD